MNKNTQINDQMIVGKDKNGNPLHIGDEISFKYKGIATRNAEGSLINVDAPQRGVIIAGELGIAWQGGTCPLEDYAEDIEKL